MLAVRPPIQSLARRNSTLAASQTALQTGLESQKSFSALSFRRAFDKARSSSFEFRCASTAYWVSAQGHDRNRHSRARAALEISRLIAVSLGGAATKGRPPARRPPYPASIALLECYRPVSAGSNPEGCERPAPFPTHTRRRPRRENCSLFVEGQVGITDDLLRERERPRRMQEIVQVEIERFSGRVPKRWIFHSHILN